MYAMKANFYPAKEQKHGYLGKATIVVANGIQINNISVFEREDGTRGISFAEYGPEDKRRSYVVPASKEAYAAMNDVVSRAVDADNHFGFSKGDYKMKMKATGKLVDEPYADGRFSVAIEGLCTLNGITTRVVEYEKAGEKRKFTAVEMPAVRNAEGKVSTYEDKAGKKHANVQFQGIVNAWTDEKGDHKHDYSEELRIAVFAERKRLKTPSLEEQIGDAKEKAEVQAAEKPAASRGLADLELDQAQLPF